MTKLDEYEQVIFWDFEFIAKPGERPDVVCLAWHVAGQTYRLWRDQGLIECPPGKAVDKRAVALRVAAITLTSCFNAEPLSGTRAVVQRTSPP